MPTNYRATGIGRTRTDYDKQYKEELATVTKVYISLDDMPENSLNARDTLYSEFESTDYITKNANMYGAIQFRFGSNKDTLEKNLDVAIPLNKDTHNLPVIDETVYITKIDSVLYYTRANYQNSPNFDSNPSILSKTLKISSENDSGGGQTDIGEIVASNIPNNVQKNDTSSNIKAGFNGTYFKRDLKTHQLSLREGDTIFQGRFGNSIRLSGYLHSNKDDGKSYPAFIIRNGESADNKAKQVYDVVDEDINNDGSSIHITSGDYITPYTPTSANSTRYQFPSEAKGDQIIVNTDRLTLSSKGDDIFLISNRNLSIFANDTVSIDASSIDFTTNNGNVRITAQSNNDVIIAVEGGKILLGADNSESSVDANQMILGNKLINLIDRLIQAINLMTIATPSGPSAPGPIDKATFNSLAKELKDCLSSTNYLV
jgi:hypothetical protein